MAIFGRSDKYKKAKVVADETNPTKEIVEPEISEQVPTPEANIEESVEELQEMLERKKAEMEAKKKMLEEESRVDEPRIIIRNRAVPVEDMYNEISDRLLVIENWIHEVSKYFKSRG